MKSSACRTGILSVALLASAAAGAQEVAYPAGYETWRHLSSSYIGPGPGFERFGGLHYIFANDIALQGLATRKFADGAVFVFDLFNTSNQGNVIAPAGRKALNVMVRDAARFQATDGWGYGDFPEDSKTARRIDVETDCHGCHRSRATEGFVFSKARR